MHGFGGESEGKAPLRRPGWWDNMKMVLKEIGSGGGGGDWISLAQARDR
jgi:hypothetical protein